MDNTDDTLTFADEGPPAPPAGDGVAPWLVLIVDDEPEVHTVTRMVLKDLVFESRPLAFVGAFSAREARAILQDNDTVAVILLDVVMETDHAGLELARWLREELGNRLVRIILRTGQPGQAPERTVVIGYDINDYKEKSELTSAKLSTSLVTALRSYRDLLTIEQSRRGLASIIDASAELFRRRSLQELVPGILPRFTAMLGKGEDSLLCVKRWQDETLTTPLIVAARGRFQWQQGQATDAFPDPGIAAVVESALSLGHSLFESNRAVAYFGQSRGQEGVIYFEASKALTAVDTQLIEIYCDTVAISLENALLNRQLERGEAATVYALAKLAEFKDDHTGSHVRRVCYYSTTLCRILREWKRFPESIDEEFIRLIGLASVLHDVGKVGIPDSILQKTTALSDEEWLVMRRHPGISDEILSEAARLVPGRRTYLSMGAQIAAAHHEKYDGSGYPKQLAGTHIPLAARILSVVDVFDALTTERPYKAAWTVEAALEFLRRGAGQHFDPDVVDAFFEAHRRQLVRPEEAEQALPL